MAIKMTPEQEADYLMSKSVMDAPRSGFQKVTDFLFGRTIPERFTSGAASLVPGYAYFDPKTVAPGVVQRFLETLHPQVRQYLEKGPFRMMIKGFTPEEWFAKHPDLKDKLAAPGGFARGTLPGKQRQKVVDAYVKTTMSPEHQVQLLRHEGGGHAAESFAGEANQPLGNLQWTKEGAKDFENYYKPYYEGYGGPSEYLKHEPEEMTANFFEQSGRVMTPDPVAMENAIKARYPTLQGESVVEALPEYGTQFNLPLNQPSGYRLLWDEPVPYMGESPWYPGTQQKLPLQQPTRTQRMRAAMKAEPGMEPGGYSGLTPEGVFDNEAAVKRLDAVINRTKQATEELKARQSTGPRTYYFPSAEEEQSQRLQELIDTLKRIP